jgi:hypothetical protein
MEYTNLGGGDYLVKIDQDKVETTIETIARKSYQTAKSKRGFVSKDTLFVEDHVVYSSDHTQVMGLNMGLINQRQCYTKLQKMIGSNDYIFRGKHFEKSGRDPEQFLEDVVKEIEKNK